MEGYILVQWTTDNIEEARDVSRLLVEGHYVACANIIPVVESLYIWEGTLQQDKEIKVIFKTCDYKFDEIKSIIKQNASYDVPEILKIELAGGNEDYLQWVTKILQE